MEVSSCPTCPMSETYRIYGNFDVDAYDASRTEINFITLYSDEQYNQFWVLFCCCNTVHRCCYFINRIAFDY